MKRYSLGQRIADKVSAFGGSWVFISFFFLLLSGWMVFNVEGSHFEIFDPYPFILLNLILSCLAAIQAPIIMMSQNRQSEIDREREIRILKLVEEINQRLKRLEKEICQ